MVEKKPSGLFKKHDPLPGAPAVGPIVSPPPSDLPAAAQAKLAEPPPPAKDPDTVVPPIHSGEPITEPAESVYELRDEAPEPWDGSSREATPWRLVAALAAAGAAAVAGLAYVASNGWPF